MKSANLLGRCGRPRASALLFQHELQPSTDESGAEEELARTQSARQEKVHLARGDREHSDLVGRAACGAGVRSRALVLSAIPCHLVRHAAHFSVRRVLNG
jgi:hypothetical protein